MEDYLPVFRKCPNCEERAFDVLKTSSSCVSCNYSPTFAAQPNYAVPAWAFDALAKSLVVPGVSRAKTKAGGQ